VPSCLSTCACINRSARRNAHLVDEEPVALRLALFSSVLELGVVDEAVVNVIPVASVPTGPRAAAIVVILLVVVALGAVSVVLRRVVILLLIRALPVVRLARTGTNASATKPTHSAGSAYRSVSILRLLSLGTGVLRCLLLRSVSTSAHTAERLPLRHTAVARPLAPEPAARQSGAPSAVSSGARTRDSVSRQTCAGPPASSVLKLAAQLLVGNNRRRVALAVEAHEPAQRVPRQAQQGPSRTASQQARAGAHPTRVQGGWRRVHRRQRLRRRHGARRCEQRHVWRQKPPRSRPAGPRQPAAAREGRGGCTSTPRHGLMRSGELAEGPAAGDARAVC